MEGHGSLMAEGEVEWPLREEGGVSWLEVVDRVVVQGGVGDTRLGEGGVVQALLGALLDGLSSGNLLQANMKIEWAKSGYWI